MRNKPTVGDRVIVTDYWTETDLEGVVDLLLSEQFRWISDDGRVFITRYDGAWRKYESGEVRG